MKMHLLANPTTIYSVEKCKGILVLLNANTNMPAAAEFTASMATYRALVGHQREGIVNFQQLAAYHGRMMYSCYLTNIQEHFGQKVKTFCTEFIVKRQQDHIPNGITRYILNYQIYTY
jgi:hypothetical protein